MHFAEIVNSNDSHCSNPSYTYGWVKAAFAGKEVYVIPQYNNNLNLTERMAWLAENFTGIPVVIDAFEGGENTSPNVMLNITELEQVMNIANVTAIRFPEVISWYMGAKHPIPTEWIHSMMDFALSKNLTIYWSEWKLGSDIEALTNATLVGYEDKITYLYQTNNQYQTQMIGYSYAHEFLHWGVSVQSWHVTPNSTRSDLNVTEVAEYLMLARNMGAEVIEFEPYSYFFKNGDPLEPMQRMRSII